MRFCKGYAHVLVHWVKDTSAVGSDLLWVANTALLNHCRGCQTNMSSGWEYREWYIGLPPRTEAQDTASLCKKHPQTTHTFHPLTLTFCLMRILFTFCLWYVCECMYCIFWSPPVMARWRGENDVEVVQWQWELVTKYDGSDGEQGVYGSWDYFGVRNRFGYVVVLEYLNI